MKESTKLVIENLTLDELDELIAELQLLRSQKVSPTPEPTFTDEELAELMTPDPKDGAWIVANSPAVGMWSNMTEDSVEWSEDLRRRIDLRIDGKHKKR